MASSSRNMKSYDAMGKIPSSTLKRHPKMDLNKNDLLRLLSYLEGELQARDISIAALKAEKAKQLLYQAKYGRFGLGDPFNALQRDSDSHKDNSFDENAVKAMYDNQLVQLENLIATQRRAQQRMREQLAAVEKRYHKSCAELEEEKQKHAQDTAQGDDVTYMLEKDRERLKHELDFDKNQMKKLEKDNKKLTTTLDEEKAMSNKHKQVALVLIKERKHYMEKLAVLQHHNTYLDSALKDDKTKLKTMVEGLAQEGHKSLLMEAALEKHLSEFDTEREQLRGRLAKEEARSADLGAHVEQLKLQLELGGLQTIRGSSPVLTTSAKGLAGQAPKVFKDPRVPVVRDSPDRDSLLGGLPQVRHGDSGAARHPIIDMNNGPSVGSLAMDRTLQSQIFQQEKPVPAQKPTELNASRMNQNVIASSGNVFSSASGNTTVFTTPSGTRISLNVGSSLSSSSPPRKPAPLGRGAAPPIPPNKPQVYIPPSSSSVAAPVRRDNMQHVPMVTKSTDASPSPDMQPSPNLDSFGPEMEDLQKLLVSMATDIEYIRQKQKAYDYDTSKSGPSENNSSSVESSPTSSISSSLSSLSSVIHSDVHTSTLHKIVASGHLQTLEEYLSQNPDVDLSVMSKDGSTVLHTAAELGHEDILTLLIVRGCNVLALNNDQGTPLHVAASDGNVKCLSALLTHGSDLTSVDQSGWTPLHWAANQGHVDCCRHLLDHGARIDTVNNASWTPVHQAIHSGHVNCLNLLLTYKFKPTNHSEVPGSGSQSSESLVDDVINLVDKDGWTVAHLAAIRESKDCLEVLVNQCSSLDLERTDKWNHDVHKVASVQCQLFLQSLESKTEKLCKVYVNVPESRSNKVVDSEWHVGNMLVSADMGWTSLEEGLSAIFLSHLSEIEAGVKTKRVKQETGVPSADGQLPFSLGLTLNSIKYYSIGVYHWSPGTPTERTPWELLGSMNTSVVAIQLFGIDDTCVDSLAYETLIPVAVMQNYLRLMEQYKNVIFYGPVGTGKTYMAQKLAQVIQLKERHKGSTEIHTVQLTQDFTPTHLADVLIEKGCLLESTMPVIPGSKVTILILDNLHTVSVAALFKDVFPVVESRGPGTTVRLHTPNGQVDYYMHPSCYILGTMDRTRSTGLELSIQQRFRWVQFRCDQEPMRCLLHRHLQRRLVSSHCGKLPSVDDKVHKTIEWVVCVWQRLNEGINKLGLQDLYYGPVVFLACPVEPNKPKTILRWLSLLWNHQLAPAVSEAVLKGSGSGTALGGQQKVANTALYVLMQRAIVSGCPLTGQEKERYLSSFLGSNELDIKMRNDRKDSASGSDSPQVSRRHTADIVRHSPGPAINPVNINVPFHRTPRGPITKAASLDSSLKEPDHLELPEQNSFHTSPDLSPDLSPDGANNANDPYGNTYFALAGFPVARPALETQQSPQSRGSKFGIPVIVTQPSSGGSVGSSGAQMSPRSYMSKTLEGRLSDRPRPGEMKRALSPQPLGTKAWGPGPDPRRALSPGPELLRGHHNKMIERNGNTIVKTDAVRTGLSGAVGPGGVMAPPGSPQLARFPAPVVVNPTKLPPFANTRPPAFKS